jgi:hypothetical protein
MLNLVIVPYSRPVLGSRSAPFGCEGELYQLLSVFFFFFVSFQPSISAIGYPLCVQQPSATSYLYMLVS